MKKIILLKILTTNTQIIENKFKHYDNLRKKKDATNAFFNEAIFKNKRVRKETKKQKKERIELRLLTIINSIQKNINAIKKHKKHISLLI